VLGGAALLHAAGIAGFGLVSSWELFLAAMVPAGLGAGCLDGGANGLVLDVYRERRGRAMNLLHMFFSVGAFLAPLAVGQAVEAGVPWQAVTLATSLPLVALAAAYFAGPMPSGRRDRGPAGVYDATSAAGRRLMTVPLLLLGAAIAFYVAAEVGVSSWLVRFLEPAPLTTATLALSLYWVGIAIGRLLSAAIADRFDHMRFAVACVVAMAAAIGAAVVAPSLPLSIGLFAVAGVASGPVYPMIVALGGDRYPDRSAAVGGTLSGFAVIGSVVYPPAMGILSVTVGLPVAMAGNVVLGLASAAALIVLGRSDGRDRPKMASRRIP
jgi:fucose permease